MKRLNLRAALTAIVVGILAGAFSHGFLDGLNLHGPTFAGWTLSRWLGSFLGCIALIATYHLVDRRELG